MDSRAKNSRSRASRVGTDRFKAFFDAVAETADVVKAARVARISEDALRELSESAPDFEQRLREAQLLSLEKAAALRAVEGISEPLVVDGKIPRDDRGQPLLVRRPSDLLLLGLLRAEKPEKYGPTIRVLCPPWVPWLAGVLVATIVLWVLVQITGQFLHLAGLVRR